MNTFDISFYDDELEKLQKYVDYKNQESDISWTLENAIKVLLMIKLDENLKLLDLD